jgi:MoaA/NifB/PqqE/SkfB family radical SAM enzyme
LNYFINLTLLPQSLIELWRHFKTVKVQVSLDDYGIRNDYLRFGSIFSELEKNLNTLLQKNIKTGITQTISALNVVNINALKKYSLGLGIDIEHNYVYAPSFMHVSNLPESWKRKTIDSAKFLNTDELNLLHSELYLLKAGQHPKELIRFIELLDSKRNIKIEDYLAEWKALKNEINSMV